jgi:hypothetical protein
MRPTFIARPAALCRALVLALIIGAITTPAATPTSTGRRTGASRAPVGPIGAGVTYSGRFGGDGDVDYYYFVTTRDNVSLHFSVRNTLSSCKGGGNCQIYATAGQHRGPAARRRGQRRGNRPRRLCRERLSRQTPSTGRSARRGATSSSSTPMAGRPATSSRSTLRTAWRPGSRGRAGTTVPLPVGSHSAAHDARAGRAHRPPERGERPTRAAAQRSRAVGRRRPPDPKWAVPGPRLPARAAERLRPRRL